MWYTHYRRTNRGHFGPRTKSRRNGKISVESEELDKKRAEFQQAVHKILKEANNMGIKTGNAMGEHRPIIHNGMIAFTGSIQQPAGRRTRQPNPMVDTDQPTEMDKMLGWIFNGGNVIKWWSESGLQWPSDEVDLDPLNTKGKATATWFAGPLISAPSINNPDNKPYVDGSYEAVCIEQAAHYSEWQTEEQLNALPEKDRRQFGCCKTNYYPFDIPVTAVLIAGECIFGRRAFKVSSDGDKKHWTVGYLLCKKATGLGKDFLLEWEEEPIVAEVGLQK